MTRVKGFRDLIRDAVSSTTHLVEDMNESVASKVVDAVSAVPSLAAPVRAVDQLRRLHARGVYGSIHGINLLLSRLGDLAQDAVPTGVVPPIVPMRSDCMREPAWLADATIGALNGAIGDHLHAQGNTLDLGMQLRLGDAYLAPSELRAARVALFVHGVSTSEWSWCMNAEAYHGDAELHFGRMLERDLGYLPVFLRYNSGRHISHNGRALAALLEQIDCEELVLIGHSMGGLVARSACAYGQREGHRWPSRLSQVVCLGTPHLGAPLEKVGNLLTSLLGRLDLPAAQVPARVINARSAGVKDLRFGYLLDEDWQGHDPDALLDDRGHAVPLLDGVRYTFIGATLTQDADHPLGQLLGDLLVRSESASGPAVPDREVAVRRAQVPGVLHHEIQNHPEVYAQLLEAFGGEPAAPG